MGGKYCNEPCKESREYFTDWYIAKMNEIMISDIIAFSEAMLKTTAPILFLKNASKVWASASLENDHLISHGRLHNEVNTLHRMRSH